MDLRPFLEEKKDPVELKGKIEEISNFKIAKSALVNLLQGLNIVYVQYLLFYQSPSNEVYYRCMVVTFFISALISLIFAGRIFYLNKDNNFGTFFVVTFLFLIINNYCFSIFGADVTLLKLILSHCFIPLYLLLQIPPFVMQVLATKYAIQCKVAGWKGNKEDEERFYGRLIRASADAGFMNNLECYLRAAPQQVVQMAVLFYNHGDFSKVSVLQQASILFAFAAMPWSSTMFQGYFYQLRQYKEVPLKTKLIYYCSIFFFTVSRISSIGGAMAFWPLQTAGMVLIHWIAAAVYFWRSTEPTEFFNNKKIWHVFLTLVFGWVYLFAPMNLMEKSTSKQYIWFYGISFVQNTAASFVWFFLEDEMALHKKIAVVYANVVAFEIGLGLIILYYKKYHPSKLALNAGCDDEDCFENVATTTNYA